MVGGKVVGLAALPGAGKTELSREIVKLVGAEYINLGELVRATAAANDFVPADATREAYLPFWRQYAEIHGEDWLARVALRTAENSGRTTILDGIRIPADARTLAISGVMCWLEADLPVVADRFLARARPEDQAVTTAEEYAAKMAKELSDSGNFAMGAVRELCPIHYPAVPNIPDENERIQHYRVLAAHIIEAGDIYRSHPQDGVA